MSGGSKTKGSAARLITVPGYHIHPQWDLVHLRSILNEKKSKKPKFGLTLAPMVDLFSILVIYLIMNFSTDGEIYFVSKDVSLPRATKGTPIQSLPLVSIVGDKIYFDSEKGVEAGAPGNQSEPNDGQSPQLRSFLRQLRNFYAQLNPTEAKTKVNLQADEKTPVEEVKKVMRVLSEEGWTGINFVVDPRSK
jgi:biopolymer transport protein ExbD